MLETQKNRLKADKESTPFPHRVSVDWTGVCGVRCVERTALLSQRGQSGTEAIWWLSAKTFLYDFVKSVVIFR